MTQILVGNTQCRIFDLKHPTAIADLDRFMSYEIQGHQFIAQNSSRYRNWDGRVRLFKDRAFPIGLLSIAERILRANNVEYTIKDNRENIINGPFIPIVPDSPFETRDYQVDLVNKAVTAGSGIIKVATGGGKSLCLSMIIGRFNIPTVVYVIGIELLYQIKETIEKALGIECGIVGDGKCDIKQITVATVWSAAAAFNQKIEVFDNDSTKDSAQQNNKLDKPAVVEMVKSAKLIIYDEGHFCAAQTLQWLHKSSVSAKHRFLFSATPFRDSGDDILLEAVGGPQIVDISATKLIDWGYLVSPEINFFDIPSARGIGSNYKEIYTNYIVNNPQRNEILTNAARALARAGKRTLVLVVQRDHGAILADMLSDLRVDSLDGRNKSSERLEVIQNMKDGKLDILIASKIFDQGIDIPELEGLVLAGSGKSSGRALQRIGRVIRTCKSINKKYAVVVESLDNAKYVRDHSQIRAAVYRAEPGFKIRMPSK